MKNHIIQEYFNKFISNIKILSLQKEYVRNDIPIGILFQHFRRDI